MCEINQELVVPVTNEGVAASEHCFFIDDVLAMDEFSSSTKLWGGFQRLARSKEVFEGMQAQKGQSPPKQLFFDDDGREAFGCGSNGHGSACWTAADNDDIVSSLFQA